MFCNNCGNKLGEQDKFCAVCGTPVRTAPEGFVEIPEEKPVNQPDVTGKKKKTTGIIVAISALALIVFLMLLVIMAVSKKKVERTFEKYRSQYDTEREDDGWDRHWEFDEDFSF